MLGQHLPHLPVAMHHIEHAVGKARLGKDFGQFHDRKWRDFTRLEYHGVTGGQSRGRFPAGDLQRIVPGANGGDDAKRFTAGIDERRFAQRDLGTFNGRGEAGVILKHIGAGSDIDTGSFTDRLAGIARFELRQFVITLS